MCVHKYISFIVYAEEGPQWLVVTLLDEEMEAGESGTHQYSGGISIYRFSTVSKYN